MPVLFVFLIKVNIALLVFWAGYYFVLRQLTFYTLNRIYLVSAILFATVYPRINLSGFLQHHRQIASPVQAVIINFNTPARALLKPLSHPDYWQWAGFVFWMGVLLLALRLLVELFSLFKIYRHSTTARIFGHEVRVIKGAGGPFSFWKSIYVNPDLHDPSDLKSILLHEQVHVNEWHSLDIILAELSTIFYWFNPGVWLMKKAVRENIEFITDRMLLKSGVDTKQYQYSLVNVSFAAQPQGLVNHFNISTIKKRIIMMNAKRSSNVNLTRYAILLPAVIALLLVFGVSNAALVKKGLNNVHKSVEKLTMLNLTLAGPLSITPKTATASPFKRVKLTPVDTSKKVVTLQYKTPDTIKIRPLQTISLSDLTLADTGKKQNVTIMGHADPSVVFVVDGKVVKDPDLGKLNTVGIATINVVEGAGDGKKVINIQTKKTFVVGPLTRIKTNGSDDKMPRVVTFGRKLAPNDTLKLSYVNPLTGKPALDTTHLTAVKIAYFKPQKFKQLGSNQLALASANFSLNHLSDKMIIINGKIATEDDLKKLSAFDIDKMVLKTDRETKDLYGTKAKNGVVFIVTKK